jgi:hypothetical protein
MENHLECNQKIDQMFHNLLRMFTRVLAKGGKSFQNVLFGIVKLELKFLKTNQDSQVLQKQTLNIKEM